MENLVETIKKGLADELSASYNYMILAAKAKDTALKKAFLNYAIEEMSHGQKLLGLLERLGKNADEIFLKPFHQEDDLVIQLVEYVAQEESAIFYYEILEKLYDNAEVRSSIQQIIQEEQRHLNNIEEIFQKIKSGEYQYE